MIELCQQTHASEQTAYARLDVGVRRLLGKGPVAVPATRGEGRGGRLRRAERDEEIARAQVIGFAADLDPRRAQPAHGGGRPRLQCRRR